MDLALAIHKINPKAAYRLDCSNPATAILEWRGPGPFPSQAVLDEAWRLVLEDRAAQDAVEQARQNAIDRVKSDPGLADIALVLRL